MAQNYTQMSLQLKDLTGTQELWLRQLVELLQACGEEELWRDHCGSDEPLSEGVLRSAKRVMAGGDADMCYGVGFYPNEAMPSSLTGYAGLIIYMEESGDLEGLVSALYEFSAYFKLEYPIGFEWANSCSKMRPGEFGGGAVVIKPGKKPKWNSTGNWLAKELNTKKVSQ